MNKVKRYRYMEKLKLATWNVRGLMNKEEELQNELKKMNIDIGIITETKKKLKGTKEYKDYLLLYSGVPQNKRASSGVAVFLKKSLQNRIHSYNFVNDRIINIRIRTTRGHLTIVGVYAPNEGKKEESLEFYELLQTHLNSINKTDYISIGGDFNARVGQQIMGKLIGNNGEVTLNENGKTLRNFVNYNDFQITNTLFRHKDIHKYTRVERGTRSIIDYILINRKLSPYVEDTRVYRGCDISSDHFLVLTKITIPKKWIYKKKKEKSEIKTSYKVGYTCYNKRV